MTQEHHSGECHHHHHDHGLGHQIVDGSYTFSREGILSGGPVALSEAAKRVEEVLLQAAECLAFEGMVPGHVKALLQGEHAGCVLSVTRTGSCDRRLLEASEAPQEFRLTVNLISAIPPERSPEPIVSSLFAPQG